MAQPDHIGLTADVMSLCPGCDSLHHGHQGLSRRTKGRIIGCVGLEQITGSGLAPTVPLYRLKGRKLFIGNRKNQRTEPASNQFLRALIPVLEPAATRIHINAFRRTSFNC